MLPEPYVDIEDEPDEELNSYTNQIIGTAIAVHKELGAGYAEAIYQKALELEFAARGIPFVPQYPIEVRYRGEVIGEGRADFLVFDKIVVDLKAVDAIGSVQRSQMIAYLKTTGRRLGLIINFKVGALKDGICRIAR